MELELSVTKLRVEEASLRDSLSKLSALNESLAQDKLGLNRLVAQVGWCQRAPPPRCLPPCTPLALHLSWSLPLCPHARGTTLSPHGPSPGLVGVGEWCRGGGILGPGWDPLP